MKSFFIGSILASIILLLSFVYFSRYHSAFEADQACHSVKFTEYGVSEKYGCDHDLETNQWLLYEKFDLGIPSKVLRRFYY